MLFISSKTLKPFTEGNCNPIEMFLWFLLSAAVVITRPRCQKRCYATEVVVFWHGSFDFRLVASFARKADFCVHVRCWSALGWAVRVRFMIEEYWKVEWRILVPGRRDRRRRKQLLDDLQEKWGYFKLKEEAVDPRFLENSLWKRRWTGRKTDNRMNEMCTDFISTLKMEAACSSEVSVRVY
jgi:hypothetical protein